MGLNQIAARLVEPARWIVIGGIAYTLASLVLFFIAPPETGATSSVPRDRSTPPLTRHRSIFHPNIVYLFSFNMSWKRARFFRPDRR